MTDHKKVKATQQASGKRTARHIADGVTANTITVYTWAKGQFGEIDIAALQKALLHANEAVKEGDLGQCEAMLIAQAASLNALFTNLAARAHRAEHLEGLQVYLRLALKAQGHCRATLETLSVIKNPPVFTRQANITSGPQQVNNGGVLSGSPSRASIQEAPPNKQLEAHGKRLDTGTARGRPWRFGAGARGSTRPGHGRLTARHGRRATPDGAANAPKLRAYMCEIRAVLGDHRRFLRELRPSTPMEPAADAASRRGPQADCARA